MWRIEFFEIMAQIGPVLLIAYVLEDRLTRSTPEGLPATEVQRVRLIHEAQTRVRLGGLALALGAEILTLGVTAGVWKPYASHGHFVAGLMMMGAGGIAFAIISPSRPPQETWPGAVGAGVLMLTGLVLFVIGFRV